MCIRDRVSTQSTWGAELVNVPGGITCRCTKGTFASSKSPLACTKCNEDCAECTGPSNSECIACRENQQVQDGKCVCKSGFYAESKAPLKCAKLEKCHDVCATCSGPGQFDCLTCPVNSDLVKKDNGNTCECKKGFFEESRVPLLCKKIPCHYSCKLCTGPEDNKCLECWTNAHLTDHEESGKKCECQPPNILWETSPNYICGIQYVKYQDIQ
eukprot:TRINITY_DN788_c0_g1_i1.p1 TRINITY_DN788_c0_g1~~TRINITY_DN788_c0_g1_i1.p1  ORF type:complete len:213 (+),score=56.57 TRINITY_DN788_c0_g1_i1:64-702(+)